MLQSRLKMNTTKIYTHFGIPRHGWLPVELNFGAFSIKCSVSNILNDPLEEFLNLIENYFSKKSLTCRVCLWLEPQGYALDFTSSKSANRVKIQVSYDDSFIPPMKYSSLDLKFEIEIEVNNLLESIIMAFKELFASTDSDILQEEWSENVMKLKKRFEKIVSYS